MRRSDRVAVLQALLERVQENASKRRRELGLDTPHAAQPSEQPAAPPPAPAPKPSPTKEDLNWTSLLAKELAPVRESKRPPPPAKPAEPPKPAEPIKQPPPPAIRPTPPPPPQTVEEIEEMGPRSELTRAIRLAAERGDETLTSEAMWRGAADGLKQRPSTIPPESDEDEPVQIAPQPALPVIEEDVEPASAQPPFSAFEANEPEEEDEEEEEEDDEEPEELPPIPTLAPPPSLEAFTEPALPPPPRAMAPQREPEPAEVGAGMDAHFVGVARPPSSGGRGLVIGLAFAAVVAIGIGVIFLLREDAPSLPVTAAATTTPAPPTVTSLPAAVESAPSVAVTSASVPPAPTGLPAPPAIRDKSETGLLWVESEPPVDVYVQGIRVGKSGSYIHVPCGLKNVRLARANPPPPGGSFPSWKTNGLAVSIPCGEVYVYRHPAP